MIEVTCKLTAFIDTDAETVSEVDIDERLTGLLEGENIAGGVIDSVLIDGMDLKEVQR